ncbi:MAG: hypothetical protein CMH60_07395 [Myxococcales bacterium]|nr:hypothetical protein [Myxococcales bacterium]
MAMVASLSWLSVSALLLTALPSDELLQTAQGYLGFPYVYGASGQNSFDCSSFVQTVYKQHGIRLPRTSREQAHKGLSVDWQEIEAGDLLFYGDQPGDKRITHVAMATGNGHMIHAARGRGAVVLDPVDKPYYRDRQIAVRRVMDDTPSALAGINELQKNAGHETPTNAARFGQKLWHHGPYSFTPEQQRIGVSTLIGRIDDRNVVGITPQVAIRTNKFPIYVGVGFPLATDQEGQMVWRYNKAQDYLRTLNDLRIGQHGDNFFLRVNKEQSLALGTGFLMDNLSALSASTSLAEAPIDPALSAQAHVKGDGWATKIVADDILTPNVLGVRWEREAKQKYGLNAIWDPSSLREKRSSVRSALAADSSVKVFSNKDIAIKADTTLSAMATRNTSLGGNLGSWLQWRYKHLQIALRGELRMHQNGFLPEVFSLNYKTLRDQGIDGQSKLWDKLDELAQNNQRWHWGWKFAGHLNLYQKFNLRWGYSASNPVQSTTQPLPRKNIEVGLMHEGINLGRTGYSLGGYAHYHQRYASELIWQGKNRSELIFAGLSLRQKKFHVDLQMAQRPIDNRKDFTALALLGTSLPF